MRTMKDYLKKTFEKLTLFKDLSAVGISSIVGNGISSIFWIVLASIMEVEEYGEVSYFIAIASVASAIAFLGAGNTLTVFSAKEKNIQSPILIVTSIASVITALVVFAIFSNIAISIYIIGYVIFNHLLYETLGKKFYPTYAKYYVAQRVLLICLSFGLYFTVGPIGVVFGYALSFFPFIFKTYKKYRFSKKEFALLKEKISFMRDSYGHSMLAVLSGYTDKLIIGPVFGFTFLGNFQLAFQIIMMLTMIPGVVYAYLLPQEASGKPHKKLWLGTILIVLILSSLTIILSPSILPVLMPKYTPAIDLIQIMSISAVPMTISIRYTSKFLGDEKSKIVVIGKVIEVLSFVIGIFTIGIIFEIRGAAMAFVIATTCEAIYYIIINRVLNNKTK